MRKVLVTGGCGFLGSWIVKTLLKRGVRDIRVMALPDETTSNIDDLSVEVVRGNVLSIDDCKKVVDGVDTVFHTAAIYKAFMPDPTAMYEVNNRGTFNIMEASRRAGVDKVIYTASIAALGRPPLGEVGDEDTRYDMWDVGFHYSLSKHHSRRIAEDFGAWGMDVRIVCPGIVMGPGDIAPTPSGKLVIDCVNGRNFVGSMKLLYEYLAGKPIEGIPPLYVDGGITFVDVRDAAEVHVLAAEKGQPGRRYLTTAHNLSQKEFLEAVNRALGLNRRYMKLPTAMAGRIIDAFEEHAIKTDSEPALTRASFEYTFKPSYFSNERSINELGASYRPIEETIRDAVDYFRAVGYLEGEPSGTTPTETIEKEHPTETATEAHAE